MAKESDRWMRNSLVGFFCITGVFLPSQAPMRRLSATWQSVRAAVHIGWVLCVCDEGIGGTDSGAHGGAVSEYSMLAWAYRVTLRDQKPCFCMAIFPSSPIISYIICANFRIFEIHFTKGFPFSIMSSFHS